MRRSEILSGIQNFLHKKGLLKSNPAEASVSSAGRFVTGKEGGIPVEVPDYITNPDQAQGYADVVNTTFRETTAGSYKWNPTTRKFNKIL